MTTELEQQFFKVFGIEAKRNCYWSNTHCKDCNEDCVNFYIKPEYPEITDCKLLEMICIIVQSKALLPIFISENIKNLKDEIIQMTIDAETKFKHNNKIDFKHQIQQLFKEWEC